MNIDEKRKFFKDKGAIKKPSRPTSEDFKKWVEEKSKTEKLNTDTEILYKCKHYPQGISFVCHKCVGNF